MSIKHLLIAVLIICAVGMAVVIILYRIQHNRSRHLTAMMPSEKNHDLRKRWQAWHYQTLQQSYMVAMKVPLLGSYVLRIRKRLTSIHAYEEWELRRRTMAVTWMIIGILGGSIVILMIRNPDPLFFIMLCIAAVVLNGMFIEAYAGRLERRLLRQMVDLLADVRHHYHRHGMVDESLYEASEYAAPEIALHANLIVEALTDQHPEERLEQYYETAPNRFLKAFAGISGMVMEYGDKVRQDGSMYLRGLSNLTKEIHLEILRRDKLDYLLKSLNIIVLVPIFFTNPIEQWARSNFPAMDDFYTSKLGFIARIFIFILILISYLLLQKLQTYDETTYRAGKDYRSWEQALLKWKWFNKIVFLASAGENPLHKYRLDKLLNDVNARITVEWLQVRRLVLCILCFVVTLSAGMILHHQSKEMILYAPVKNDMLFGSMSIDEQKNAQELADLDRQIMLSVGLSSQVTYEQIAIQVNNSGKFRDQEQINTTTDRILLKLKAYDSEYFRWWELLIALMMALIAYQVPVWMLYFQKKARSMDMKHEVYQFHTVISMLSGMDRMSVEVILEWMNRFAVIFKLPLQKCLLHYEHGPEDALEQLKDEVSFPEFGKLVDKLHLAVDKIPIPQAFDDLESDMSYYFEQRRQEYEKMIETKATWGKMIGFTPMYALIFLYLVLPLIGMSFSQMEVYYDQIQKI
ncbi:hypothetical protein PTI45_00509 [Paenibacillus nuruki]|uniref:Uncharacterized protein n=1 Tax=Paenibacillus nuruki TaxID=1886670 RepID=A0A1E3L8J3_9BACL|nr:hypothetical protein [Paenibacillus nuruki]ODP30056.1 hypothetical protein PTI45_00509 [Paenibacillus nuruki]